MKKLLLTIVLLIVVSGCATRYHQKNLFDGYSEQKFEESIYQVSFDASYFTDRDRIEQFIQYHSAEIVIEREESKIVKYIFSLWNRYSEYPTHLRVRRVNRMLFKRGYRFRKGVSFKSHHIHRIINNPFYKGVISIGDLGTRKHQYGNVVSPRLYNLCN